MRRAGRAVQLAHRPDQRVWEPRGQPAVRVVGEPERASEGEELLHERADRGERVLRDQRGLGDGRRDGRGRGSVGGHGGHGGGGGGGREADDRGGGVARERADGGEGDVPEVLGVFDALDLGHDGDGQPAVLEHAREAIRQRLLALAVRRRRIVVQPVHAQRHAVLAPSSV